MSVVEDIVAPGSVEVCSVKEDVRVALVVYRDVLKSVVPIMLVFNWLKSFVVGR